MRRILVIRLDLLGDLVMTMPALEGLRRAHPHAEIAMLTLPYTARVAEQHAAVDEVFAVDTNRIRQISTLLSIQTWHEYLDVWRRIRRRRFDLCLSVYGRMGSLCAFLAGARRSVGFAAEQYPGLLKDPQPGGRYRQRRHEVQYVAEIATAAGAQLAEPAVALTLSGQAEQRAAALLSAHGVGPEEPYVVVHAGSLNGSSKRWPAVSWARFSQRLQEKGFRVVLIGSASEQPIADAVLEAAETPLVSLVGETNLDTLTGVIACAALLASGDSGPLHLAVALGRPVLGVYGPTDPVISGPHNSSAPARVLRRDLACSPCYTLARSAECPLGDPICMRLVSVQEMVDAALELLRGIGQGRRAGGAVMSATR